MSRPSTVHLGTALVTIALLAAPAWAATQWTELQPGHAAGAPPVVDVREVEGGLIVALDVFGFHTDELTREGTPFASVSIPETGIKGEIGHPAMPFRSVLIPVPNGPLAEISSVVSSPVAVLQDVTVMPAQAPMPDCGSAPPEFVLDDGAYGRDAWYPAEAAVLVREAEDRRALRQRLVMARAWISRSVSPPPLSDAGASAAVSRPPVCGRFG